MLPCDKGKRPPPLPPQVSWVRHSDVGLISVGKFQYIRDPRFKIVHAPRSQEWMLVIRAVRFGDEGPYECQVNTSPIRRETVHLTVVGKYSPRVSVL